MSLYPLWQRLCHLAAAYAGRGPVTSKHTRRRRLVSEGQRFRAVHAVPVYLNAKSCRPVNHEARHPMPATRSSCREPQIGCDLSPAKSN